jgi:hypothetical protein
MSSGWRMVACGALVLGLAVGAAAREPLVLDDFEDPGGNMNEVWQPCALDPGTISAQVISDRGAHSPSCLKVTGKLPEGLGVSYLPWQDWLGYTRLSFDVWFPASARQAGDSFGCIAYLKDHSYYWYQTPLLHDPKTGKSKGRVKTEQWLHFDLDISSKSAIWRPGGHGQSWGYALHRPRELGLRLYGKKPWQGGFYLDNVVLSGEEPVQAAAAQGAAAKPAAARVLKPVASAASVPVYEKLELTFPADAVYENPYDPDVVDVEGVFTSATGTVLKVPGFFYQAYERSQNEDGFERLNPVGRPSWKVRFAPTEAGTWTYQVSLKDARGTAISAPTKLQATAATKPQGYVRVSKKDPLYLEYDNGEYFWPLGINMRDGGDDATNQKGTYDFDQYFKRFQDEGLNLVRTWMCAWWAGVEWSDEYHSRFDDVGRYNQYNAWRLDYCVDLARQHDLELEITLNSHGQLRRDKFDEEWTYSPWNTRNGGYVASPAMFFTSEQVKRDFRNRYRYIVARWGYSRNIMSWDLWNEVDLSEGYDPERVSAWHQEMARYLKALDPWKHMVETHICLFWSFGNEMWRLPEIEAVQSDAYWDQKEDKRMDMGMYASYSGKTNPGAGYAPIHQKPFIFVEYGPLYTEVAQGHVTPELWRNRFRTGMWTSAVLPTACPGLFWYHKEWDQYGLYKYQKPLVKVFGNFDRRGRNLRMKPAMVAAGDRLRAIGMADDTEGYFYIHDPANMGVEDRATIQQPTTGARLLIPRYKPGAYQVEFIDTLTGDPTQTLDVVQGVSRSTLQFDLPPVADDLLVRITRKSEDASAMTEPLRFVHVCDLHLTDGNSAAPLRAAISQINAEKPDFVVLGGDLADTGQVESYKVLREVTAGLKAPCYPLIGNHDLVGGKARFEAEAGPLNQAFDCRGYRVLCLDSTGPTSETFGGEFQEPAVKWLAAQVAALTPGKPVILFTHHGVWSQEPWQPLGNLLWDVLNWEPVHQLLAQANLVLACAGHAHMNADEQWGATRMLWTASLSANRDNHGGVPAGFRVVDVRDGKVTSRWEDVKAQG